jgi:hypothetical protein
LCRAVEPLDLALGLGMVSRTGTWVTLVQDT